MLNLIMFLTMYPVVFVFYFVFRNEYVYKNGSLFAVNLNPAWVKEPEIETIIQNFKKEIKRDFILLLFIPIGTLFTKYMSIQVTIWSMWILFVCFLFCMPLVHANCALKNWKKQRHFYEQQRMEHYIELKSAGDVRRVHVISFLIPIIIGFFGAMIPLIAPHVKAGIEKVVELKSLSICGFIFAVCGFIFLFSAVFMDRQPTVVISDKSDVNINYTRAKKNIWKNFWLGILWFNTAFIFAVNSCAFFAKNTGTVMLVSSVVYAIVILGWCIPLTKQLNEVEAIYEKQHEIIENEDNDNNWIGGILYYNPKDRRVMVSKKAGMGTTINLASTAGKASAVFSVLCLLIVPVCCGWVMLEEFTPIRLSVENQMLCAKHLNMDYEINVENIENLKIITELPAWSKSSGTGMETLEKGTFFIRNVGKCKVFLNLKNQLFLSFSADGMPYYMSGFDDEQTKQVYENLIQLGISAR